MALNTNLYLDDVEPDAELHDVDVEASWLWLERTMVEARRKGQNVSRLLLPRLCHLPSKASRAT